MWILYTGYNTIFSGVVLGAKNGYGPWLWTPFSYSSKFVDINFGAQIVWREFVFLARIFREFVFSAPNSLTVFNKTYVCFKITDYLFPVHYFLTIFIFLLFSIEYSFGIKWWCKTRFLFLSRAHNVADRWVLYFWCGHEWFVAGTLVMLTYVCQS